MGKKVTEYGAWSKIHNTQGSRACHRHQDQVFMTIYIYIIFFHWALLGWTFRQCLDLEAAALWLYSAPSSPSLIGWMLWDALTLSDQALNFSKDMSSHTDWSSVNVSVCVPTAKSASKAGTQPNREQQQISLLDSCPLLRIWEFDGTHALDCTSRLGLALHNALTLWQHQISRVSKISMPSRTLLWVWASSSRSAILFRLTLSTSPIFANAEAACPTLQHAHT